MDWISLRERRPELGQWVVVKVPPFRMKSVHDYRKSPSIVGAVRTNTPQPTELWMRYEMNEYYNEPWFTRENLIVPLALADAFGLTHWMPVPKRSGRSRPTPAAVAEPVNPARKRKPYDLSPQERARRAEVLRQYWRRRKGEVEGSGE